MTLCLSRQHWSHRVYIVDAIRIIQLSTNRDAVIINDVVSSPLSPSPSPRSKLWTGVGLVVCGQLVSLQNHRSFSLQVRVSKT